MTVTEPIFFGPNRVWRCYTGGLLLERFVGAEAPCDAHLPEDWLASTVRAINGEHSRGPDEGLARTVHADGSQGELLVELLERDPAAILGEAHAAKYGPDLGVLCKYLDSAVRLPIQCHPDVPIARELYDSEFGKTESWHILDTRTIDGEEPYLLMGFKPGVTKEAFAQAVEAQDVEAMVSMLHKLRPQRGETYFVPARLPHAIGPGVFMVETQEPSDWVIQPERFCADTRLSDADMWGPLTPEQGLGVFDYTGGGGTAGSWIGVISTDWNTGGNWGDGTVPTSSVDVTIPNSATTPFDPTISAAAVCADITIETGGIVNGGSGTLTVHGNWLNDGVLNGASSTVVFVDAADQSISGTGQSNFYNLNINKPSGKLNLNQNIGVAGKLDMLYPGAHTLNVGTFKIDFTP